MVIQINQLHPLFAAEMIGIDTSNPLDQAVIDAVEATANRYAVVAIRDASLNDADHIRFSRTFGPLELPPSLGFNEATKIGRFAPELYDVSNLDENGDIEAAETLKRKYSKGNELFHSDSSFNSMPTKWSLLLGHIVPPEGGETEFVDTRIVYETLPEPMRRRVDGLVAEHNVWRSRERAGFTEIAALKNSIPPARHPLVRDTASGRRALYIGSHADHIVDMDVEEGRALLDELTAFASQPQFIYAHKWLAGDLVIWDNRSTMHRATAFDFLNHKRDLRRTTINESGAERTANFSTM